MRINEAEVRAPYPQLEIVEERPNWVTDDQEERVRERMTIDIDDAASEFLEALNRGGPPDAEQGA